MNEQVKCEVCGKIAKLKSSPFGALCSKHATQYYTYGKISTRTKYDSNEIVDLNEICEIYLYDKSGNIINKTIIDSEDKLKVQNKKWCLNKDNYVISGSIKPFQYLHRLIMNTTSLTVDHINGDTLDNRKSNLRLCTNADNLKNRVKLPKNNTSGILGVRFRKDRNKWYSELQADGKTIRLGSYLTKEEAIKARKDGEEKYFKEYKSIINNEIN